MTGAAVVGGLTVLLVLLVLAAYRGAARWVLGSIDWPDKLTLPPPGPPTLYDQLQAVWRGIVDAFAPLAKQFAPSADQDRNGDRRG